MYKLTVFIPDNALEQVKSALFAAGAGTIGNYEAGKRTKVSKPILQALAGALQVSVSDLHC